MQLVSMKPLLEEAQRGRYAVPALNSCAFSAAQIIIEEAVALRSPALLLCAPVEWELLGPHMLPRVASLLAAEADVPVCLHLDHATDLEDIRTALDAGWSSVMLDGSRHDFEENVRLTRLAVEAARPRAVPVEGELGAVGRADDVSPEASGGSTLTDPDRAAEFVERTGVDFLAVSIGNAHGVYKQQPELDFERLAAIRDKTGVPLVLHGGSGTPLEQLQRAVELGIAKVNVATEFSRAYLATVQEAIAGSDGKIWWAHALGQAKDALRPIARRWMHDLGSAGRL